MPSFNKAKQGRFPKRVVNIVQAKVLSAWRTAKAYRGSGQY